MSYRLIDANAIASQCPEVNGMPCIYVDLDKGLDECHYDLRSDNTLQAENAKLRELVCELWSMAYWYVPDLSELDESRDFMRELGIEVVG